MESSELPPRLSLSLSQPKVICDAVLGRAYRRRPVGEHPGSPVAFDARAKRRIARSEVLGTVIEPRAVAIGREPARGDMVADVSHQVACKVHGEMTRHLSRSQQSGPL